MVRKVAVGALFVFALVGALAVWLVLFLLPRFLMFPLKRLGGF